MPSRHPREEPASWLNSTSLNDPFLSEFPLHSHHRLNTVQTLAGRVLRDYKDWCRVALSMYGRRQSPARQRFRTGIHLASGVQDSAAPSRFSLDSTGAYITERPGRKQPRQTGQQQLDEAQDCVPFRVGLTDTDKIVLSQEHTGPASKEGVTPDHIW